MTQLTVEIIQEGPERIVEVVHEGPRGVKGNPGETLVLTGPALAGRASGTGTLVPIPLAPGLAIVNGVLTLIDAGSGSVTSVGLSVPTGFSVTNSPVTSSGTIAVSYAVGYSLPTTAKQAEWNLAYQDLGLARAPTAHKSSHATGGTDVLSPADIGAATAAQGTKADTAVQPAELTTALAGKVDTTVTNAISARLDAFRDAATFYVSKRGTASDSNNGTSEGEPFLTISAAVAAANAYVTSNPGAYAKINVGPGRFVETSLPLRLKPQILAQGSMQRGTIIEPAAGQELNGFFALDSGCMVCDFRFAGHQASGTSDTDSSVGTRAWAIRFNEQANGGQGVFLTASPYVKDCASITAEDDSGLAGSTSTGDTGGGIEVDGAKCNPSSPVRSMVVYGYTQQNLGGPGVVVRNDGYAELVSFFGLFCTWHVQAETGGWATLSGGGCSEFGIYGVVADGYSATALFTGSLRVAASSGAITVDVVSLTTNRIGSSSRPHNGQIMLLGGTSYVVVSSSPINSSGTVVADSDATRVGYRVSIYNPTGVGLVANAAQGATADFRRRSQVSAGCHTALFVGSGTNYNALPWNGGVPVRANQFVERNFGRVFGLSVNDAGDLSAAGGAFAVDGTSGAVTINTSSFNISGLNNIGPFSRNGGLSTVGVQLQEVSNNTFLISSTGVTDSNTVPTQVAVAGYVSAQLAPYLTSASAATSYQPFSDELSAIALLTTTTAGRSLLTLSAVPTGALVGTTDAQILSGKIFENYKDSVQVLTISGSTYTIDCNAGSEALITSVINGNITINLGNTASVASGTSYSCTLTFTWTSGAITWFSGNSGFSVMKQALPTLASGSTYKAVIQIMEGKIYYTLTAAYS